MAGGGGLCSIAKAGVGGCCVMVGIAVIGTGSRGANSEVGDIETPLSRLSSARNAANHLISSSSLGAQSTNVRFAVMSRNVCSFSPRSLSLAFELGGVVRISSFRSTRRDPRRVGGDALGFGVGVWGPGASESDSEGEEEG